MSTFGNKIIEFNKHLNFTNKLPEKIKVMNPFKENGEILLISERFYNKFYNDNKKRKLMIGINPGRFGAGVTGIPFTDTKRLKDNCGIEINSPITHEPSSVFIYELIEKYGGVEKFYGDFYINSIFPLALINFNKKGNWVNCNYYDYPALLSATKPFIIENLKKQISFGIDTEKVFVLGKKNADMLKGINEKMHFFKNIITLDHPRFIVQYKLKFKDKYLNEYLEKLSIE